MPGTAEQMRLLAYAAMIVVVVANVAANIFMKLGSSAGPQNAVIFGLFGWQTLVGIACFGTGAIFYALALKVLPLYVAQAAVAFQYVGVGVAASTMLGEPLTPLHWLGIALIIGGVILVSY